MKTNKQQKRICPLCHQAYYDAPAISRVDNQTPICPDCGTRQALQSIGISKQETEQILFTIHSVQTAEYAATFACVGDLQRAWIVFR